MQKKIIIFSLFFIMIFSSNVFAKTIETKTIKDRNKPWIISFNKEVKSIQVSITDENNEYVPCATEEYGGQIKIIPMLGYYPGDEFILKVMDAKATDGSKLKEPIEMKFIIEK